MNNKLLLAVVAIAVYWFATQKPSTPNVDPKPATTVVEAAKSVFPATQKQFRTIFEEAATLVESGKIKSDEDLFNHVAPATKLARETANKSFDVQFDLSLPRNEDGTFVGKEKETAELLRRIAKSW